MNHYKIAIKSHWITIKLQIIRNPRRFRSDALVEAEQWSQRVAAVEKASQKLCTERLGRLQRGVLFWGVTVGKQWWFYSHLMECSWELLRFNVIL